MNLGLLNVYMDSECYYNFYDFVLCILRGFFNLLFLKGRLVRSESFSLDIIIVSIVVL